MEFYKIIKKNTKMNDAIDLGEWIVPTSWEDISLLKYESIERFYADKDEKFDLRQVLHIMCDKTEDEVNALPVEALDIILEKLEFLKTPPKVDKPTNKIEIDGETYQINFQNKLKTGEFVAAEMAMKDNQHNYAALLAILCRKPDEVYDSKFENEILEDRIKLFEQQPITKILPLVSFFLNLWAILEIPTQLSSQVVEEINHTVKHIETLHQNGEVSKRYMKSLTKKLKKLEKSIKSI